MKLLKQAPGVLGALVVLAVIVAFVAPKRARALAAALVQIVPGTTTHVGQNESQLVSLVCPQGNNYCLARDPEGNPSTSAYVVPAGYTLIVTDYQWFSFSPKTGAGILKFGGIDSITPPLQFKSLISSAGPTDQSGSFAYVHEHFVAGVRIGSGVTPVDVQAINNTGFGLVQGYLVPND
jgi:hypothetical protein